MERRIRKLCKRAKKADKEAAGELLKIFYADIYTYLRWLCDSRHDAEDLTQQTFLKVWSSLGGFAGRSKFSTWLYRIAHNTYLDWLRKNSGSMQPVPEKWWQDFIDENPGPSVNLAERQMARRVFKLVDELDEDKKHVVHLHYYQGLSIRETAKVLNIATSTVKYRLREVLKILRIKLGIQETEFKQERIIPIAKGESI
jgi:RNA polymerase sigma-70 factor (ECF subfamily)